MQEPDPSLTRARSPRLVGMGLALVALSLGAGFVMSQDEGFKRLNLPGRSDSRPFTHTIVAGETIYIAGTLGLDPETNRPPKDPKAEVKLAMDGIRAKLELAGASMDDLVSVQVFCPDMELYADFNEVYGSYFSKGKYPVRTFVGSGPLLFGSRFEINGIAVKKP